jgi:hypothetical protein
MFPIFSKGVNMVSYHLVPDGDNWKLKKEDRDRTLKKFESKKEALPASIEFVKNHSGSLKIHKSDGSIQEERTYPRSIDPKKSKG